MEPNLPTYRPYSGEVEVHPELACVGRGLGRCREVHKIWDTPEEAIAIHARWCETMRALGRPEKIVDPETEAVWKVGEENRPIAHGKIISDFVKNGSLSVDQYRRERSELKTKFSPEGKGLFVCAACSASLEDFYFVAKYKVERYEFSFDFQDFPGWKFGVRLAAPPTAEELSGSVKWRQRSLLRHGTWRRDVVDVCCGTCLTGHQNLRIEEDEEYTLTNFPETFYAAEIRKKRKKKRAAAAKRLAKEVSVASSSNGM